MSAVGRSTRGHVTLSLLLLLIAVLALVLHTRAQVPL